MERINRMSPRTLARTAGVLYVLEGATSVFGASLIPGKFIVPGDAAATAANILGNEPLYLLGITASLISVAMHTALTVFLYDTFKPVGRVVAQTFAFIGLMAITGLGYFTFLWPPLANDLALFNLAIAAPGELSFVFWLLLAGVNSERWKQQARAAEEESRRALE